ncbi:aldehyde dehydrogenase (NAD+) [Amaricoccus macauensis]|uniref:Aldehyde dehydrogenase (NAD+) n=1 Tax=Amaricoccus macauensis TaxID=57001 RepID=A0A840SSV7_9RHOB|nr:aldehyde dehydrogenase family protein [Amaricoccus macauensis]MBB5223688.1 aldehyde dehydrogenase (NAD+) [Amaricoccus macauensis]
MRHGAVSPESILIAGAWRGAASGESLPVHAPDTGEVIGAIARGGAAEIDAAVNAARTAFEGPWGRTAPADRGRILARLAALIAANADDLVASEAEDCGKPLKQARADIAAVARYFEFYAGAADKVHGETIPYQPGFTVMVQRVPHGVTGHIIPWNYPAQMFGRTLAPALATGNACVLKPAEAACATVLRLAALAMEAGLPAGALNVVTGLGSEAGAALAAHPGIDFLSFTGSPDTGTAVQKACAEHHRACTLELGGKSPQIVFADADLDRALPVILNAIVQNAGQTCSAGSRLLVERRLLDTLVPRLAERFAGLRVGPSHLDADCGPLISETQLTRVRSFLDRADADGLPLLAEGGADALTAGGYYVAPRLYGPVPEDHPLAQQEVFGPVLALVPFEDEADAIRIANGTAFGLVAGIWTENGGRQMRMATALRAGQVFVNGYGAGSGIELPFGGMGRSGHGREKGMEALREFTVAKTVVLNHG